MNTYTQSELAQAPQWNLHVWMVNVAQEPKSHHIFTDRIHASHNNILNFPNPNKYLCKYLCASAWERTSEGPGMKKVHYD